MVTGKNNNNMNKNILIVTYDMIPYAFTWGGCQRMYYLAQRLIKEGSSVSVFALRAAKYNTFGKQLLPSVVFGNNPVTTDDNHVSSNPVAVKSKGVSGFLKKIAFKIDPLVFNEITPGNGIQAYNNYRKAKKKLKQQLVSEEYDVIIVSAPPFVVFDAIGLIRELKPQQKIVMDYRDPWNSWHTGNKLCERREKRQQNQANVIICTNQALCDDMAKKYGIERSKYHVVENGYMIDTAKNETNVILDLPHDKMNIVYTGAIGFNPISDGYRDTVPLFEALDELVKIGLNNYRLVFVGEANSDIVYLNELKQKFSDNLFVVGKVDSDTAKEYVRQSDVCLLLHTAEDLSGKFLISGKAYDYIQNKKYMFSISRGDSQHSTILNTHGIGINVPNEKIAIMNGLKKLYKLWQKDKFESAYKNVDILKFSRDAQLSNYISIIENL